MGALLIEVRLAFRSVVVIPCFYFYCMQLHLRGDVSASRFLVGLYVCERAGEDAVEKIKKPVTTDDTDKKNSRFRGNCTGRHSLVCLIQWSCCVTKWIKCNRLI